MELNVLFWNVRGAHAHTWAGREPLLRTSISRLAAVPQIDILILAEYAFADADLLSSLNNAGMGSYYPVPSSNPRLRLFSRLENARWKDRFSSQVSDRMTAHTLRVGNSRGIILVGFHGKDRMSVSQEADRANFAQEIASDIRLVEKDIGHRRTLVVGDFNMTPYEQGMVAAKGMHALMSKSLTHSVEKLESRFGYPCFYNPMWSLLGDQPERSPGSFFFSNAASATNTFWLLLDQVLVRREMMDLVNRVTILDHDGTDSLVTNKGRPRKATFSDHLPLFFTINI
jgi:hypothetical protein